MSGEQANVPGLVWILPFVLLLLAIAVFPLWGRVSRWWDHNSNKLIVSAALSVVTLTYYVGRGFPTVIHHDVVARAVQAGGGGVQEHEGHVLAAAGGSSGAAALGNGLVEFIPFMTLLFSLYTICGGVVITGDIPAHPRTNTALLAIGGLLASIVGTTGASMLLIRPLLHINSERRRVAHTVVFFIFIVSNVGGCLLPIGDPPLFIGYLRGVPFLWTLHLWKEWAFMLAILLAVYYVWERIEYHREAPELIASDEARIQRVRILGGVNFIWLGLVICAVAMLDTTRALPGLGVRPPFLLSEIALLVLTGLSMATTPDGLRHAAKFNFHAIAEVACLFIGIFITMQAPLEILDTRGSGLGLTRPWQFFWSTGTLSAFLDNTPTYAVFFETANALTHAPGPGVFQLVNGNYIRQDLLVAISLGAVFMGAMTYIGNGPNFMVKAIAERAGVRMPGFFRYMLLSAVILIPLFVAVTLLFLV